MTFLYGSLKDELEWEIDYRSDALLYTDFSVPLETLVLRK